MSIITTKPEKTRVARPADPSKPKPYGLIAEFETPAQIVKAAERVRDEGYKWWDCCTPFPVHGLDKAMGIRQTILPIIVFFMGLSGTCTASLLQAFTNASDWSFWAVVWVTGYPYLISGKPLLSTPAFIPVMFELTILFSALTTVGLMFAFNGLPQLYHPLFRSKRFRRASDDRFFVVIEARDPRYFRSRTAEFLKSLDPVAVEEVQD